MRRTWGGGEDGEVDKMKEVEKMEEMAEVEERKEINIMKELEEMGDMRTVVISERTLNARDWE